MGAAPAETETAPEYGRTVTKYASVPKFGGYYIGKYAYSDKDYSHGGDGLSHRLIRAYVDGTIFGDFKYRVQVELCNSNFHMKDVFLEWQKYSFFKVKVGQFKRAFGFENPMNPWDISTGDYSQFTKKLTGMGDYVGDATSSNGGRDQGIQIQGDLLPVGKDNHNLIHYQVGLWNGQGINSKDKDGKKDIIGTIQVQPIKNLYVGFFGWHGNFIADDGINYDRNRYAFGAKYENNGWSARAEWGHGQSNHGKGNADAWYVLGGMPINDWLRISAKYDVYRLGKEWSQSSNIYSIIPEIQLHKNLKLQVQYNWNDNRSNRGRGDVHYNELWGELYFRF